MPRTKKKKPTIEDDTSNLPCDIIPNILCRLPVKSLLRFKAVSKPWNSIISDPKFTKRHLNQSKNSDCRALCISLKPINSQPQSHHLYKFTTQGFQREGSLLFPRYQYLEAEAISSYNGLVLLKKPYNSDKRYALYNPSIRVYTTLPCPYWFDGKVPGVALCHDLSTDDYKVLFVDNDRYVIFSYMKDSWTEKKYSSKNRSLYGNKLVVVHGVPHWIVVEKCKEDRLSEKYEHDMELVLQECYNPTCLLQPSVHYNDHPVYEYDYCNTIEICYLDHKDDEIKKLSKPVSLDQNCVFRLTSLRGQLCLHRNTYDFTMMEIWMMKTYGNPNSWTKLLMIENIPGPRCHYRAKPLCFTCEDDIVLEFSYAAEFVIYSPSEKKFGEIQSYEAGDPIIVLDSLEPPRKKKSSKRKPRNFDIAKEVPALE